MNVGKLAFGILLILLHLSLNFLSGPFLKAVFMHVHHRALALARNDEWSVFLKTNTALDHNIVVATILVSSVGLNLGGFKSTDDLTVLLLLHLINSLKYSNFYSKI
jgi:hypothetical protein